MKYFSLVVFSVALTGFAGFAMADDFGARFGSSTAPALQDAPDVAMASQVSAIQPAAGDASVTAEASHDLQATAPSPISPSSTFQPTPDKNAPKQILKTPSHADQDNATQTTLDGPADPEPTQAERTESNIIHFDRSMGSRDADDPSYRLQDSTN